MMTDSDSNVPRVWIDTHGLAPASAVAQWRAQVGVMFETQAQCAADVQPRFQVEACHLGQLALGRASMWAQRFDRPASRLWRDGLDHFLLQFYTHGACRSRLGRHPVATQPGDLWVTDLSRPLASEVNAATNLTLVMPRALLAPLLLQPDDQHLRILDGRLPLVTLLREHVQTLLRTAPGMRESHAALVTPATLALAAAALNGSWTAESLPGMQTGVRLRVLQCMEQRLHDPLLDPATLAAYAGISLRTLHYLFEADGGVMHALQRRRLHQARRMLADPACAHLSIAQVAQASGFRYAESFSRAFSRRFGLSARSARAFAREGASAPPAAMLLPGQWDEWIRVLA